VAPGARRERAPSEDVTAARFDPETILVALERERVKYVVIGGLAAIPTLRTLLAEIRNRGQ
jgi:hypothetical protein